MKAKERDRFTLKFRNVRFNTYVLYEKYSLFSDTKWYIVIYGRNGESCNLKELSNIDEWDIYKYSALFANAKMEIFGEGAFEYMKSKDFIDKLEFFKGCEMNYNLWNETCNGHGYLYDILTLKPTKDYNKLLNNRITYNSQQWKLKFINIEKGLEKRVNDKFYISIESLETGKRDSISFESSSFRLWFFQYWALYLWAQFCYEPDYCNHIGDLGVFNTFVDHSRYYKWLEDNYVLK